MSKIKLPCGVRYSPDRSNSDTAADARTNEFGEIYQACLLAERGVIEAAECFRDAQGKGDINQFVALIAAVDVLRAARAKFDRFCNIQGGV